MLEMHVTIGPKPLTKLRQAIERECARANADPHHAETINTVVEQTLGGAQNRCTVFVVVNVLADATLVMVRDDCDKTHWREIPRIANKTGNTLSAPIDHREIRQPRTPIAIPPTRPMTATVSATT